MNEDKLILRPKRVKGEDGYKTFSIRVREDLWSGWMSWPPRRAAAATNW